MEILNKIISQIEEGNETVSNELLELVSDAKKYLDVINKVPSPLFSLLIVKPIEPGTIQGGVIMPDNDNQHYGVVLSKGDEVKGIEIDEIVLWLGDAGEILTVEDEEFILMPYKELKGVIRD
jgi:hypothetical protein